MVNGPNVFPDGVNGINGANPASGAFYAPPSDDEGDMPIDFSADGNTEYSPQEYAALEKEYSEAEANTIKLSKVDQAALSAGVYVINDIANDPKKQKALEKGLDTAAKAAEKVDETLKAHPKIQEAILNAGIGLIEAEVKFLHGTYTVFKDAYDFWGGVFGGKK